MSLPRTTAPSRRAAAALVIGALLVAGCGASAGKAPAETVKTTTTAEPSADPNETLRRAVDATVGATSFSQETKVKLEVGPQLLRLTTKGSFDYDTAVGEVLLTVNSTEGSSELTIRSDGTTFWVRVDGDQAPSIPDDKTWLEGDVALLAKTESFQPSGLIGVLYALRASRDAEQVDSGSTDGVDTTTYETTIAYDDAVKAAGDDAEAFKSSLSLRSATPPDLEITVEVGSDGIIRSFDLDIASSDDSIPLDGTYSVQLMDVNKKVESPEPPPEDDTLTGPKAEKLLKKLLAQ